MTSCSEVIARIANATVFHPEGIKVYNLEVEQAHTYFVLAENAYDGAVWVHNAEYVGVAKRGSGTLTAAEEAEIQAIANRFKSTIDVVDSRAAGKPRDTFIKDADTSTKPEDLFTKPANSFTKPEDCSIKPANSLARPEDCSIKLANSLTKLGVSFITPDGRYYSLADLPLVLRRGPVDPPVGGPGIGDQQGA